MKKTIEKKDKEHSFENETDENTSQDVQKKRMEVTEYPIWEQSSSTEKYGEDDPLYDLIEDAIDHSATDVHLDLMPKGFLVRYRIDGMIHEIRTLSFEYARKILVQTRVTAGLNFGRTFVPLEGQFTWIGEDNQKDIRVTIVPIEKAEAVHFRVLTLPEEMEDISKLGFSPRDLEIVKRNLSRPQGLVIVAGPTGSGKTTTIYTLASTFNLNTIIAASIENPIEFNIPHIRQIEVDEQHGMTIYEGLKTLLRMDPDLLIIPEIRDPHSALTAARAGSAARFVLTTLHARDAAAAVEAFHYLSVPYSILGGALRVIISQELVRKLCSKCMEPRRLEEDEKTIFEESGLAVPDRVFEAKGCEACDNYGYRGQIGIFEVVEVDEDIGKRITQGISQIELRKLFRDKGYKPMIHSGLEKVSEHKTSMDELYHLYYPGAYDENFDLEGWKAFHLKN